VLASALPRHWLRACGARCAASPSLLWSRAPCASAHFVPPLFSFSLTPAFPDAQLLEAAELVKQIEETFGVDASAPAGGGMMMMAGPAGAAAEAEEAQTEFNLIITDCAADKRIAAIKVVRTLTSLGLKEAKDAVTALPFTILEAKGKADVDKAKAELEAAGCKCEIK